MSEFNKNEFDPKAAAEARKAELEEITKKLEKGVKDVFSGENFKEYLNFCAKLPRYSVNNQLLIMYVLKLCKFFQFIARSNKSK